MSEAYQVKSKHNTHRFLLAANPRTLVRFSGDLPTVGSVFFREFHLPLPQVQN